MRYCGAPAPVWPADRRSWRSGRKAVRHHYPRVSDAPLCVSRHPRRSGPSVEPRQSGAAAGGLGDEGGIRRANGSPLGGSGRRRALLWSLRWAAMLGQQYTTSWMRSRSRTRVVAAPATSSVGASRRALCRACMPVTGSRHATDRYQLTQRTRAAPVNSQEAAGLLRRDHHCCGQSRLAGGAPRCGDARMVREGART